MVPSGSTAFDRLRKESKRLLKALRAGDQAAILRFARHWSAAGKSNEAPTLVRAQLVVAREHGYRSWSHLRASLLGDEERSMKEQKQSGAPERRLGVYTYEEAESLLGIPANRLRILVEEVEGKPCRYLDAILLEKVWVKAKPFLVAAKREDGRKASREDGSIIQNAILEAGGTLAMHMAQYRFASMDEAEQAAKRMRPLPGYTWIALEQGFEETMEQLKKLPLW